MRFFPAVLWLTCFLLAYGERLYGGGTVMFSNRFPLGQGEAPFNAGGALLGPESEYSVELFLADGEYLSGPVGFSPGGIFEGGIVHMPEGSQGKLVDIELKVSDDDGVVWSSGPIGVVVGQWTPLYGLKPVDILASGECLKLGWSANYEVGKPGFSPVECVCTDGETPVVVERSLCDGLDLPASLLQIEIRRVDDEQAEISWLQNDDAVLLESPSLTGTRAVQRSADGIREDGKNYLRISTIAGESYYRLSVGLEESQGSE